MVDIFKNSEIESFNADYKAKCDVKIDGSKILVTYQDSGRWLKYEGEEVENDPGHYKLTSRDTGGRATLHRFAEDNYLEGFWIEGGHQGMWRIFLNEDD